MSRDWEYEAELNAKERDQAEADWHAAVEKAEYEIDRVQQREAALAEEVIALRAELEAVKDELARVKRLRDLETTSSVQTVESLASHLSVADATIRSLRDEAKSARAFHPRAMKLIEKRKNFVVVAEDEPYFIDVYMEIRKHEKATGRWTDEDERIYRDTFTRWHRERYTDQS